MVKFFLLMVVISVVIRIGLSLVLPPHWAAVGQLMGTLAFGLCILLSPLRPRYFQYPSVRDQEKVPQDNEQPHGELYFVGSDNRSLYPVFPIWLKQVMSTGIGGTRWVTAKRPLFDSNSIPKSGWSSMVPPSPPTPE